MNATRSATIWRPTIQLASSAAGYTDGPWYYLGSNEDPRLQGERPDLRGKVLVPDVPYQAHSASLTMTFYTANNENRHSLQASSATLWSRFMARGTAACARDTSWCGCT